jgi:GWxTD domain-containing protein
MREFRVIVSVLILVFLGGYPLALDAARPDAHASCSEQGTAHPDIDSDNPNIEETLAEAQEAPRRLTNVDMRRTLRRQFEETPAYVSTEHGSLAYWHARAEEAAGNEARMWRVLRAHRAGPCPDVRVLDWIVYETSNETERHHTYLQAIGQLGADMRAWEAPTLRRYVAWWSLIVEEETLGYVVENPNGDITDWRIQQDAAQVVQRWWREHDPVLRTARNERLNEHLSRIQTARTDFSLPASPYGFDERGQIYVRYGPPYNTAEIRFDDVDFVQEIIRLGSRVSHGSFRENTIWTYPHIDRAGRFVFLESDERGYVLGDATDLVPVELRRGFNHSEAGQRKAMIALRALRHIYREIAVHYGDFGGVYGQIDEFLSYEDAASQILDMRDAASSMTGQSTVRSLTNSHEDIVHQRPGGDTEWPSNTLRKTINDSQLHDRYFRRERAQVMPENYTNVLQDPEELPVVMRALRFLTEDGTTRTDLYWAAGGAAPSTSSAMTHRDVEVNARAYTEAFEVQQRGRDRIRVQSPANRDWGTGVRVMPLWTDADSLFHLGVQWMQYDPEAPDTPQRVNTVRMNEMRPLRANGALELSDIKPLQYDPSEPAALDGAGIPILGATLPPDTPLALYFEVYNLSFGPDDRTQYTIEYEVEHTRPRGGLVGRIRGDETSETSTETTYEGTSRRSEEYIVVDPSEVAPEGGGQMAITVHITDEHTGDVVERAIQFTLREGDG